MRPAMSSRARPDQPCDGRRRGRLDHHPQRPCKQAPLLRAPPEKDGARRRGQLGEEFGVEHDPPVDEVGDPVAERDQRRAALSLDFEQVAGAEILDRDDGSDRSPVVIEARQADQVA